MDIDFDDLPKRSFRNQKNFDHSSPMKKVVNSYQDANGNLVDVLECGHEVSLGQFWHSAKKRRCKVCFGGK